MSGSRRGTGVLLVSLVLLAAIGGCGGDDPPVGARRDALTVPLPYGMSLHVWDRNLVDGERIALQPATLNRCVNNGATCYMDSGNLIGALQDGWVRSAPFPALTAQNLLSVEIVGTPPPYATSLDLRLRTPAGGYLTVRGYDPIPYPNFHALMETQDPGQAMIFRLDHLGDGLATLKFYGAGGQLRPCGFMGSSYSELGCDFDLRANPLSGTVRVWRAPPIQRRNLAFRRPTWQSSTNDSMGPASKAVDGNPDGAWIDGSVTHTKAEPAPMWLVDLGATIPLREIHLYNRTDCCAERLANYSVLLSNDGANFWTMKSYGGVAPTLTVMHSTQAARFVGVKLNGGGYLHLAEVEVFGAFEDVGMGHPVYQTSTMNGAGADRALDGWPDSQYGSGSVSHTNYGYNTWWVELEQRRYVDHVLVYNRTDCCSERLAGSKVEIRDADTGQTIEVGRLSGAAVEKVNVLRFVDRVAISTTRPEYLSLAEVVVAGR